MYCALCRRRGINCDIVLLIGISYVFHGKQNGRGHEVGRVSFILGLSLECIVRYVVGAKSHTAERLAMFKEHRTRVSFYC
jgi:hypothetical protein